MTQVFGNCYQNSSILYYEKQVSISEPERLVRFMNSFHDNHSDDFKALVLHLISHSDIETVSLQTSVPVSTLYDWQSDWNKKKS